MGRILLIKRVILFLKKKKKKKKIPYKVIPTMRVFQRPHTWHFSIERFLMIRIDDTNLENY